jgi:hypothetical protein
MSTSWRSNNNASRTATGSSAPRNGNYSRAGTATGTATGSSDPRNGNYPRNGTATGGSAPRIGQPITGLVSVLSTLLTMMGVIRRPTQEVIKMVNMIKDVETSLSNLRARLTSIGSTRATKSLEILNNFKLTIDETRIDNGSLGYVAFVVNAIDEGLYYGNMSARKTCKTDEAQAVYWDFNKKCMSVSETLKEMMKKKTERQEKEQIFVVVKKKSEPEQDTFRPPQNMGPLPPPMDPFDWGEDEGDPDVKARNEAYDVAFAAWFEEWKSFRAKNND